jgi:hypothetical protein
VKTLEMRFCGFCGTEVPGVRETKPVGPWGDLEARFALLEKRAMSQPRRRRQPSDTGVVVGYGARAVFGLVFAGFAVFFFFVSSGMGAGGFLFKLVPLILLIVGIGIAVKSGAGAAKVRSSPLRRVPVLVVDERTEVSGGGRNSSATTTYYVTLQYESGRRREFEVGSKVSGQIAEGDMGLAYTKAYHLLDFDRVDV